MSESSANSASSASDAVKAGAVKGGAVKAEEIKGGAVKADEVKADAVLPLSPSFTGWDITSPDVQPPLLSRDNKPWTLPHESASSTRKSDIVDLTADDDNDNGDVGGPNPGALNQHSSSTIQHKDTGPIEGSLSASHIVSQGVDVVECSEPSSIPFQAVDFTPGSQLGMEVDLQQNSQASDSSGEDGLEQLPLLDPTEDLSDTSDDIMIVPKKYRKASGEHLPSHAFDAASLHCHLGGISKHSRRNDPPGFRSVAKTKRKAIPRSTSSNSVSNESNETDIDEPMPRLLPRFTARSMFDLTDEDDSSTDDDSEDVITKEELGTWLRSQAGRDLPLDAPGLSRHPTPKVTIPPRNLPVRHPFCILETYSYNNIILRKGVNIELRDTSIAEARDRKGTYDGVHNSFMRIVDVIQDTQSLAVTLRGWIFQRASYLNGIVEKKRNEVCWVMHVDEDDERDMKMQSMETVPVEEVLRRRKIRLTNQSFPRLSFREDEHALKESQETIRNERVLVCRYIYVCYYACAERREANCWSERSIQRLRHMDCDRWAGPDEEPCALDDGKLREDWRGGTIPGGAYILNHQTEDWHRRLVDVARQNTVVLTDELLKPDPEVTLLPSPSPSPSPEYGQPFQITGVATRVDWITPDGTEHYTINGCVPPKRRADTDMISGPTKRHRQGDFSEKLQQPASTISVVDEQRRKSSVVEIVPCKSVPRPTEPHMPDTKPNNVSSKCPSISKNQYTFGDSFCGAGGMSRAAHQAGLHIRYAFDCNKHACNTYALNFPEADLHCLWAHDFVQQKSDCKVDIAHLSPPCQFFSDAHTVAGKDDEMNTASLFAVGEIINKSKPRVVTLEQTFGIVLRARHQGYLNALVQIFTSAGFSIRWRLLHCADYGLPQMRLRTFMIASCPGEPLPSFPRPTHTSTPDPSSSLLPWSTIASTIRSVPHSAPNHDLYAVRPRNQAPYSGTKIARTITCNGGGMVHPSGTRDFTIREFAALQGFPHEHVFGTVGAKRQVGNAVPPVVGRAVLAEVVRALEREDGVVGG
ncbi:MAG: hypothetical protein Q9208_007517 [Pyrenodesmia sp. 3 TL-2023]